MRGGLAKWEYCQEEDVLGFHPERSESLEGDHLKCWESLLVLQVLNYKSRMGQDFGKGPQSLNIGTLTPLSHLAAVKIQLQNGIII